MRKRRRNKRPERRRRRVARRIQAAAPKCDFNFVDVEGDALKLEAAETVAGADPAAPKLRRFNMTVYTGGKLMVAGYMPYGVVIDLSGLDVGAKSRPILRDHQTSQIVGHTTEVTNSGGRVKLAGVVSGSNAHAAEVEASADKGFPWQASIGARPTQVVYVDRGEKVEVNGRKFSAWLEANGWDEAKLTAKQRQQLEAAYQAEIEAAEEEEEEEQEERTPRRRRAGGGSGSGRPARRPVRAAEREEEEDDDDDPIRAQRIAAAEEIRRVNGIRTILARYPNVRQVEIEADGGKKEKVDLEAYAVEAGWSTDTVELHALRASRGFGQAVRSQGAELNASPLEAAILASIGMGEKDLKKHFDEKTIDAATDRRYRGAGLHMVMDAVIAAAGMHYAGNRKDEGFMTQAILADRQIRASAAVQGSGFTTLSLSGLLGNVAHKTMIASYDAQEVSWPFFCGVRNNTDFKAHTRYRLDANGSFKKVGADGELRHAGLTDAGYSASMDTFGLLISLTRRMRINDDLDAFAQIPRLIGRLGALRPEEAAWALLLSNPGAFFSVANKNLLTGAGSALSIAGYTAAEKAFLNQVDSNGKPILTSPKVLLSGTGLKVPADQLAKQTKLEITTTVDKPMFADNPHSGKFTPVSSGYANNTALRDQDGNAFTGQSDTLWWLFADPAVRAAIVLAFLNGVKTPTIEFDEAAFNVLGMQWRGYIDFGVGMEDPTGAVQNAGA